MPGTTSGQAGDWRWCHDRVDRVDHWVDSDDRELAEAPVVLTHHPLTYRFGAWTGGDAGKSLMPKHWQAKSVARWLMRDGNWWNNVEDFVGTTCIVEMPWAAYRVLGRDGRVELCKSETHGATAGTVGG